MFFFFFCVTAFILFGVLVATAFLAFLVRHSKNSIKNVQKKEKVSFCAVLGSGGHTTEMMELVKHLGVEYNDRTYVIADTDSISADKVFEYEKSRSQGKFELERIPRSREVGQSYVSSVFSTLYSAYFALELINRTRPNLVLLNGPGTCIPVAFAAALLDIMRLSDTVIIYEESICRVKKLSLSGAILYYSGLVDDVLVQWPDLKKLYPRCTYIGELEKAEDEKIELKEK